MDFSFEAIIFYILILDSLIANLLAWTEGKKWYRKNFRTLSRMLPLTKAWTSAYFILVLWIGYLTFYAS